MGAKYSMKDIQIPWTRDQKGMAALLKAWQSAKDAQDFMKKHSLSREQFAKAKTMASNARIHIPTIKKHRLTYQSQYDWDVLRKIAIEAAA